MEKHNTVHAIFTSGEKVAEIKDDVWQYDFGQILQIEGLPLPPVVEVHYANKGKDIALPQTGVTEGGITERQSGMKSWRKKELLPPISL